MNNRQKMYATNSAIKQHLLSLGFHSLYLFPHLRFLKDYILDDCGFDAMGWKKDEKVLYLFQFKTNEKPSKKILEKYHEIENKYGCKCIWATKLKGNGVVLF